MNAAAPTPRRARVRAPELIGKDGWLNTGGTELTLADLRGKCGRGERRTADRVRGARSRRRVR